MTKIPLTSLLPHTIVLCLLLFVACPLLSMTTFAASDLPQPFSITQLHTTSKINPITYAPENPTDTFPKNTETIYVTLSFNNAPVDSKLKVEWRNADDQLIGDHTLEIAGNDSAYFSITPTDQWIIGQYQVLVYFNDRLVEQIPFQIQSSKPTSQPAVSTNQPATSTASNTYGVIREYTLAKDVHSQTYRPIDPTNRFYTDQPYLYLSLSTHEAPKKTVVQIKWYYVANEDFLFADQQLEMADNDTAYFSLSKPEEDWPHGLYKVAIYVNGEHFDTLPFRIIKPTKHDYVQSVCMTYKVDEESFEPKDVTYLFFNSDPEIHVLLAFENLPKETPFNVIWYYYEEGTRYQVAETPTTGSGTDTIDFWVQSPEDGFWLGNYEVEVYINDQLYTTIPFQVVEQ